jgi:[acyl-carrier-protein] S-malonyltransferase
MAAAAVHLRAAIDRVPIRAPKWPIVGNVSARPLSTEADIRQELAQQIAAPVRWEASIRTMLAAGATTFLEVGPGKVLTGLLKRIAPEVEILSC